MTTSATPLSTLSWSAPRLVYERVQNALNELGVAEPCNLFTDLLAAVRDRLVSVA